MKKILRENIYSTLVIFCFILAILIYWIIRFYYPTEVYKILMEVEPGYLLLNEKLGRGTFGDMYGALNTFFSGLAFIGAFVAIFLQIYLYRHDKAIAKQEKEDEERQLLYYIWFRLDSIIRVAEKSLKTADTFIEEMGNVEFYENRNNIGYQYNDEVEMSKADKQLKDIDIEKNHLIYLKYLNNEALIKLLESTPKFLRKVKSHVLYINESLTQNPVTEFSNELRHELSNFMDVTSSRELPFIIGKSVDSIRLYVGEHLYIENTDKISFNKLQELGRTIFDFINSDGKPIYIRFKKLHEMKDKLSYNEADFFQEKKEKWKIKQVEVNAELSIVRNILNDVKSKSKIPETV